MRVKIAERAGTFAENKDTAKALRMRLILPALRRPDPEDIVLDFEGVTGTTQSFIHALVADAIRDEDLDALDHLVFANCGEVVQSVVEIVVSYAQEQWEDPEGEVPEG